MSIKIYITDNENGKYMLVVNGSVYRCDEDTSYIQPSVCRYACEESEMVINSEIKLLTDFNRVPPEIVERAKELAWIVDK